jgi:hypothetical protein
MRRHTHPCLAALIVDGGDRLPDRVGLDGGGLSADAAIDRGAMRRTGGRENRAIAVLDASISCC